METWFSPRPTKTTVPIVLVTKDSLNRWLRKRSKRINAWVRANKFTAGRGKHLAVPGADGKIALVLVGPSKDGMPWDLAALPRALPTGRYALQGELDADAATAAALGWALGCYQFTRYKRDPKPVKSKLVWPENCRRDEVLRLAEGVALVRDLITTPADDMGPSELEAAARELAGRHAAEINVITGDQLLAENYPSVHAVGRACDDPPRLIDIRWGDPNAPKVTLVGKGVCFDSGGLDLKGASGMLLMKKDMGGGAHVLGLAHAIMDAGLGLRLRVLVPAVENSVSGNAFRPLDVLQTRKGITVEVGNTDAEGRLILSDALAEADSEEPEVIIDFATLTGAARVALGAEVPALFSNRDEWAEAFLASGEAVNDPLWRMPLVDRYRRHLESKVADISNTASTRYGGAITAALFLQRFVTRPWVHIDVMAYNLDSRPGRPKGGEAMGLRAMYHALAARYPVPSETPPAPEATEEPPAPAPKKKKRKKAAPKRRATKRR